MVMPEKMLPPHSKRARCKASQAGVGWRGRLRGILNKEGEREDANAIFFPFNFNTFIHSTHSWFVNASDNMCEEYVYCVDETNIQGTRYLLLR